MEGNCHWISTVMHNWMGVYGVPPAFFGPLK